MPFAELEFQPRASSILRRVIQNSRIAHAYLFSGAFGTGKELGARLFAQALNCEQSETDPCGECRTCDRIGRSMDPEKAVYPDIWHLEPGKWVRPDGSKQRSHSILIDAVRGLCGKLYSSPLEARRRVVIVHEADTMQIAAQNAFLKTLEEPLEQLRTVFVLLTERPLHLLPTIRSRCQSVFFGALPVDTIQRELIDRLELEEATARALAAASDGSLGQALEMAKDQTEDGEGQTENDEWLRLWHRIICEDATGYRELSDRVGRSRETLHRFLTLLLVWHRDLLARSSGVAVGSLFYTRHLEMMDRQLSGIQAGRIIRRMERIERIRKDLDIYIRGDLALTGLLLEIISGADTGSGLFNG